MENHTKQCRICGKNKIVELFKKDKSYKGGYSTICKECHNARNKTYGVNKEKARLKAARWRKRNPEKAKESQRKSYLKRWENGIIQKYREDNKDHFLKYKREWRKRNSESENKRTQKWRKNNPIKYKLSDKKSKEKRHDEDLRLNKKWKKKQAEELSDYYIKALLRQNHGLKSHLITKKIIQLKKFKVLLHRHIYNQ